LLRRPKGVLAGRRYLSYFTHPGESAVDFAEAVVSATHHNFVASKSIARDVLAVGELG
jgi:hypothetical protein